MTVVLGLLLACRSTERQPSAARTLTAGADEPGESGPLGRVHAVAAGELQGDEASLALDATWRELEALDDRGLALVREGIREVLANETSADPFFLVDTANYLVQHSDNGRDFELAIQALMATDPADEIVALASVDVFRLLHRLGVARDPRVLRLTDRLILPFDRLAALPEHALFQIPAWVQAAWVYGLYGAAGEEHLRTLLADQAIDRGRIFRILQWIGSEESVSAARSAFARSPADEPTTDSYMRYLLTCGGHEGLAVAKAWLAQAEAGQVRDAVTSAIPAVDAAIG